MCLPYRSFRDKSQAPILRFVRLDTARPFKMADTPYGAFLKCLAGPSTGQHAHLSEYTGGKRMKGAGVVWALQQGLNNSILYI